MLEGCQSLAECEQRLSEGMNDVTLLGDLDLSEQDGMLLARLIRKKLDDGLSAGTHYLESAAPTCLACFLVWTAATAYREGCFWPVVAELVGLCDPNWQNRWGRLFVDFLRARKLPRLELPDAQPYLSNILLHGGIPNSCLPDFFEKVLEPFVRRTLANPHDKDEILYWLGSYRKADGEREAIEQELRQLEKSRDALLASQRILQQALKLYDDIVRLWRLEEQGREVVVAQGLPSDCESVLDDKRRQIEQIEHQLQELARRRAECERRVAGATRQYQDVLKCEKAIKDLASGLVAFREAQQNLQRLQAEQREVLDQIEKTWRDVSAEPWRDEIGEMLASLSSNQVLEDAEKAEAPSASQHAALEPGDRGVRPRHARRKAWPRTAARTIGVIFLLAAIGVPGVLAVSCVILGAAMLLVAEFGRRLQRHATSGDEGTTRLDGGARQASGNDKEATTETARMLSWLKAVPVRVELAGRDAGTVVRTLSRIGAWHQDLTKRLRPACRQAEQVVEDFERRCRTVGERLGLPPGLSAVECVQRLEASLRAAKVQEEQARDALEEVRRIAAEQGGLTTRRDWLQRELQQMEQLLQRFGDGNLEEGRVRLRNVRRCRTEAARRRAELERQYKNLEAIEEVVRQAHGQDGKQAIDQRCQDVDAQLRQVEQRLEKHRQYLVSYPTVFPGVDEPIRRYLLYGRASAERFFVAAVELMVAAMRERRLLDARDVSLPERVVRRFRQWWEDRFKSDVRPADETDSKCCSFLGPAVFFDPRRKDVIIKWPRQRVPAELLQDGASLVLWSDGPHRQRRRTPLRLFDIGDGQIELGKVEMVVPAPARRYCFRFESGSAWVREWDVELPDYAPVVFAFDGRTGRLLREEALPRQQLWLVVDRRYAFCEQDIVQSEEGELAGNWSEYRAFRVDLGQLPSDALTLRSSTGQSLAITLVSCGELTGVEFSREPDACGLEAEGGELYLDTPPDICVPIDDAAELDRWHLSLSPVGSSTLSEAKHVSLAEIGGAVTVDTERRYARVSLKAKSLLGPTARGRFLVRVYCPPWRDWRREICIIPRVEAVFEPPTCLPAREDEEVVARARLSLPPNTELTVSPPVVVEECQPGAAVIRGSARRDCLPVRLVLRETDREVTVPLSLPIPKIRWRLQGAADERADVWYDTIQEEMWLGDLSGELKLMVEVPAWWGDKKICLRVKDGDETLAEMQAWTREGYAVYDLAAQAESIRRGSAVKWLRLDLDAAALGVSVAEAPLLSLRTRWEATDIQCVDRSRGEKVLLDVTWQEKGVAENRVLRLWRQKEDRFELVWHQVLSAPSRTTIELDRQLVPSGYYLLQLEPSDPWSSTAASSSDATRGSHAWIFLDSRAVSRTAERYVIDSVQRGRVCYPLAVPYYLHIVGRIVNSRLPAGQVQRRVLVKTINEGWYVANLEVRTTDEKLAAEFGDANPVKIEWSEYGSIVRTIEDRHGEGAMYCYDCEMLYWDAGRVQQEEARNHRIFGPSNLEFRVRGEPE